MFADVDPKCSGGPGGDRRVVAVVEENGRRRADFGLIPFVLGDRIGVGEGLDLTVKRVRIRLLDVDGERVSNR